MNAVRVKSAIEMMERYLNTHDVLVSTKKLLQEVILVLQTEDEEVEQIVEPAPVVTGEAPKVIISCDASIKVNPGGPASIGVVIQAPGKPTLELARPTRATTNNQAEYDAVYIGLTNFFDLCNNCGCPVEIRSDSQLVIKQLKGEISCQDKTLARKRDLILEVVRQLPVQVLFEWRPRNSTPELEKANFLAQDLLGVTRH